MIGISKIMIVFGIILSTILYWASSNVCRYNFAIDKKSNILNIITKDIDPSLYQSRTFYYKELNCNKVNLNFDLERMLDNFRTITVLVYQELNTDIRGNPIELEKFYLYGILIILNINHLFGKQA